jgi:hypothetical protein
LRLDGKSSQNETLSRKDQRLLRNRFAAIRDFPSRHSDYMEYDASISDLAPRWVVKNR